MKSLLLILFISVLSSIVFAQAIDPTASKLKQQIDTHCASCHTDNGEGVVYTGDFFDQGVLNSYVDFNDPKASEIYTQVASGDMPQEDNGQTMSDGDRKEFLKVLEDWINGGGSALGCEQNRCRH